VPRLRAASFWRLLSVYAGAEVFWPLALGALAISVAAHAHRLRSGSRGIRP
jgi:hypothetical protein